jgi:hypothetical protein
MPSKETLFWLKFWHREKSWKCGLRDRKVGKPFKVPAWASRRSYNAGYTHHERQLAVDNPRFSDLERFSRPLEITASTNQFDYEVQDSAYWPPPPPRHLLPEEQAEIDRLMRNSAALIVMPCWVFHKNDPDPWPSILHGHHNERPLKLDAISGFIYSIQTRKHVQSLRHRELGRVQLALMNSKDFGDRARAVILPIIP